jgi:hypothetical protein
MLPASVSLAPTPPAHRHKQALCQGLTFRNTASPSESAPSRTHAHADHNAQPPTTAQPCLPPVCLQHPPASSQLCLLFVARALARHSPREHLFTHEYPHQQLSTSEAHGCLENQAFHYCNRLCCRCTGTPNRSPITDHRPPPPFHATEITLFLPDRTMAMTLFSALFPFSDPQAMFRKSAQSS